jgi:hypothetical protein
MQQPSASRTLRVLFIALIVASAIACSAQQGSQPPFLAVPLPIGKQHPPGGVASPIPRRSWPCGNSSGSPGLTWYCYSFAFGDSVTVPVTVYSVGGFGEDCSGYYYDFQEGTFPTPWPTPFSLSVPGGVSGDSCWWVTVVDATMSRPFPSPSIFAAGGGSFITSQSGWPSVVQTVEAWIVQTVPTHAPATPFPSPTPGINLFDFNLAEIVTNTTQSAVVGQQQLLQAVAAQPGVTLEDCNWTVGGAIVGSYNPYATSASPSPTSLSDVQQVNFYWLGSGANTTSASYTVSATCSVTTSHGPLSASATYQVKQPTYVIQPTFEPSPDVKWYMSGYDDQPGYWLAYAPTTDTGGVHYNYSVANVPVDGAIVMTQLVYTNDFVYPSSPPATPYAVSTTNGQYWNDGGFPYFTPDPTNTTYSQGDGPGVPVGAEDYELTTDEDFQDYFMYLPNDDNVGDSIWVTLAADAWMWGGAERNNWPAEAWIKVSRSASDTSPYATALLPSWPNVIYSLFGNGNAKPHHKRRKRVHSPPKLWVGSRLTQLIESRGLQ